MRVPKALERFLLRYHRNNLLVTVVMYCTFKHALFVNTIKVRSGRNHALLLYICQ